ncbi:MAG: hypothetical protein HFJ50_09930 [Clostridia bacterium]|jgi:hypothetical protein|nr:hypothetical protein [Clostridia bacterium]
MNIRKRFFSFLMAFAMLVSCMTVAHATEVKAEETNNAVESYAGSNLGISPRYHGDLTGIIDGTSVVASGSFTVLEETYVTLVINCKVDGNVVLRGKGILLQEKRFKAPGGTFTVATQKIPAGTYSYVITLHNNTQPWAGKFMATDYYYNDQK